MESSKLGYWLQVGANIGILVGLILVGLQIQQSIELTRVQLDKQDSIANMNAELHLGGEEIAVAWQKAIENPKDLSLSEMRTLEALLWGFAIVPWHNNYRMYELGLIEDHEWRARVNADAPFGLGYPYARAWWADLKTKDHILAYLGPDFVVQVDKAIANQPMDYIEQNYGRIQDGLDLLLQSEARDR